MVLPGSKVVIVVQAGSTLTVKLTVFSVLAAGISAEPEPVGTLK
jgi:hypothetical protein